MKALAITLGSLLTAFAVTAFAENDNPKFPEDPDWLRSDEARRVYRDNIYRDNLYRDNYEERRLRDDRWRDDRYRDERDYRGPRRECWNPRARHFESVREGERQDDLDFSRCRIISEGYSRGWR